MKITFELKEGFKKLCFVYIFVIILIFQSNSQLVNALQMDNYQTESITEELRLEVPTDFKEVWLDAERNIWDPWLSSQDGFLGRQIFWDKEKEEALILVKWKNKTLWKNISIEEVKKIQEKFENKVMESLNLSTNPFKLIYESELFKQG